MKYNKVGIVNFHYSKNNYGAVLQAAALQNEVEKLGLSAEHINFIPKKMKWNSPSNIKKKVSNVCRSAGFIVGIKVKDPVFGEKVFDKFRNEWISVSKEFYSEDELKASKHCYDSVVVGSDQVWRVEYTGDDFGVYFLNFLSQGCSKISYAASFGNEFWNANEETTSSVKTMLADFSAISVREISGVEICKKDLLVDATNVLDPTLLAGTEFFRNIIGANSHPHSSPGLVYYKLDANQKFTDEMNLVGDNEGLEVENIYYRKNSFGYKFNSVPDWLSKIANSKIVITDSFHCVCFAILFEKQFIYYANDDRGMSRLESLLGLLGLSERIYKDKNNQSILSILSNKIDYDSVNSKLQQLRRYSKDFLSTSIYRN
ncbi:polysaccharide pyruvyl transferase family protein [Vibrio alginolyticus]|uniref:polysaccharide pyruvyl transferase family protein n=1 Tax=Vibrio chagasii TaxID=170679 RepID=UPI001EFDC56B|nr:polysaccharide pyruvyl transferase family protein [Vibrio chagasii]MCG9606871.1 polysaccharide pyruvyl transferase family protein [Vibrio chagasii]MDE9382886.1 polysaccharide pyruvyl transferase family protein [Vibrio alginolyticus]